MVFNARHLVTALGLALILEGCTSAGSQPKRVELTPQVTVPAVRLTGRNRNNLAAANDSSTVLRAWSGADQGSAANLSPAGFTVMLVALALLALLLPDR
jgi:hypothetical protein